MLNYEVALRRADPNAKGALQKAAATDGVTTMHLRHLAEVSLSCSSRELGRLAFEKALGRLMAEGAKDYAEIADVQRYDTRRAPVSRTRRARSPAARGAPHRAPRLPARHTRPTARPLVAAPCSRLIQLAPKPAEAWPYFRAASSLLDGFSDANCPLGADELQWFVAEAWNRGASAFREGQLAEAEQWMASAFSFSTFSASLAPWREELNEGYAQCLRMMNASRAPAAAGGFADRMSKRILELDEDMASRRKQLAA